MVRLTVKLRFYLIAIAIVSFCLVFTTVSLHNSYAVPFSTCENAVNGKIVSMTIESGGRKYDVLSKQGTTFDASIGKGYSIKVSLVAQPTKSSTGINNLWITNTAYGFSSGACTNVPNISIKGVEMGQAVNGLTQDVKWGSWPNTEQVNYKVRWH